MEEMRRFRKMTGVTRARQRMDMTKEGMAGKLGVAGASLGTWEHGKSAPTEANKGKLMEFLGFTKISQLYADENQDVPKPEPAIVERGITLAPTGDKVDIGKILETISYIADSARTEYIRQQETNFELIASEYQHERDKLKSELAKARERIDRYKKILSQMAGVEGC